MSARQQNNEIKCAAEQFAADSCFTAAVSRTGSSSLLGADDGFAGQSLPGRRGGVDYRALREAVTIAQVLDLVGWKPVARSGPQLRGPCPIHKSSSERSRSFSVNTATNLFQCFGCGGKGNQLDLYMALTEMPILEAARDLVRRLGIDPLQITRSERRLQ